MNYRILYIELFLNLTYSVFFNLYDSLVCDMFLQK